MSGYLNHCVCTECGTSVVIILEQKFNNDKELDSFAEFINQRTNWYARQRIQEQRHKDVLNKLKVFFIEEGLDPEDLPVSLRFIK